MKWIIYTLLLINLVVALWHFSMPELNEDMVQSTSSEPRLVTLSEFTRESATPSSGRDERCFSLGPFSNESDAKKARQQLRRWGIEPELDKNEERVQEGYWVLLPPASSRDAAQKSIRELKLKGEKDFFLVVSGQQENAISLGVFARSESANRRLQQIKDKGFKPIVQTIHLPSEDYWLDWPITVEVHLTDRQLQKIKKQNPDIGQVERACPGNT